VRLLITDDATAREIHELTHVPRSKIYATLERMSKKKYVEIIEITPAYFRCIDPEKLTEKLKDEFLFSLQETLKELNSAGYSMKNMCCYSFLSPLSSRKGSSPLKGKRVH